MFTERASIKPSQGDELIIFETQEKFTHKERGSARGHLISLVQTSDKH